MNSRKVAKLAALFACAIALSLAEQILPAAPFMPPGARLGLSHVVVMYCVFCLSKKSAAALALLKSFFVLATRGPMAAALSLAGGALSLCALFILVALHPSVSYSAAGIAGSIIHNVGQLLAYSLMTGVDLITFYLPSLVVFGIATGILTGTLLKLTSPLLGGRNGARDG